MIFDFFVIVDFVWYGLRKKIRIWIGGFFFPAVDCWWWGWWMFVLCWCFFWLDVFIIILMYYLYYFNQIAKNIAPLLWDVRR